MTLASLTFASVAAPLAGGILIGLAASWLWLLNGRVFGISGILGGALREVSTERQWRLAGIGGLLTAGVILQLVAPETVAIVAAAPLWQYAAAGLLVGFGTQLGSGCTSGHGVCGISRGSPRSLAATLIFMAAGMLTVLLVRQVGGGL